MNKDLLILKLQALFHDPPEKALILGRVSHEERARDLLNKVYKDLIISDETRRADHIASAADRINFPKDLESRVDFHKEPSLIHPLSGREFKLPASAISAISGVDYKDVITLLDDLIKEISQTYSDLEQIYLSLWGELLDILKNKGNGSLSLGQWWEILPADTRIPDHSIWEHRRITSAIVSALPKPALFLFTIGPVQNFISMARKTQDLWAGSYLLSYLSWTGMKVIAEDLGPDSIIFPDLYKQPFVEDWLKREKGLKHIKSPDGEMLSSPTLPNRFLAIVPEEKMNIFAEKVKKAVKDTFRSITEIVRKKIEDSIRETLEQGDKTVWEEIWKRQAKDFIETYWGAVFLKKPHEFIGEYKRLMGIDDKNEFDKLLEEYKNRGFEPNEGTIYEQAYHLIEKALGSRKNLRDFHQQEEPNHKCTICGEREPIHPGKFKGKNCSEEIGALRGFWQEVMLQEFPHLRRAERLCAICTTKRFVSKYYFKEEKGFTIYDNFPSVGMVATASFKLRVLDNMNINDLITKVGLYVEAIERLVGDRCTGIPIPMIRRASKDKGEIAEKFARLEGEWIYKESLADTEKKTLWEENKEHFKGDKEAFEKVFKDTQEKLKELYRTISTIDQQKSEQIGSPSKYYAVILMDGDNMGKWLSGELAPTIKEILHSNIKNGLERDPAWRDLLTLKRPLSPSLHLSISKALRNFSLVVVREIVERDHLGKLVYSGGDDVLAFVSLNHLPEVMKKLRAYFSGALKIDDTTGRVEVDFKEGVGFVPTDSRGRPVSTGSRREINGFLISMGDKATASMGVVIAHYSENLSEVLRKVRETEEDAKGREGKDALCISLLKRAGGEVKFRGRYYYEENGKICETLSLLNSWVNAFQNNYISPKFEYTLRKETIGLQGLEDKIVRLEILRIAERHRNKKVTGFNKESLEELIDGLMYIYHGEGTLEQVAEFLSIAVFLGREENR
jgi:CRISPR-associated protein Cmr2